MPTPYNAPEGFDSIVRVAQWSLDGNHLAVTLETASGLSGSIRFAAVTQTLWKVSFVPPASDPPRPTPMIALGQWKPLPLSIRDHPGGFLADSGGDFELRISLNPWSLGFASKGGKLILGDNRADIDGLGRPFVLPLGYVPAESGNPVVTASFHLSADEQIFGLGEKFTPLNKVGQRIVSWTVDALGSTSERSHKNIPFLWSTRGYGLFADTSSRIAWDIGTESCQSWTLKAETTALDIYVMFSPEPAGLLGQYAELTGHAPVPPKWTFGLWVSSGGTYRDQGSIGKLVDGLDTNGIRASVVHVDPWWMRWRHYCDFLWDQSAFPDPARFINGLHSRGLRLCLWEHPYISVESELFAFGVERGYFVRRGDGSAYVIDYGLSLAPRPEGSVRIATAENSWNARVAIIDLTNPDALRWFQDLHRPLLRQGVDVFKTDFGEDIPLDALFFNGETGASMHNLYPLLYNKAVYEVTKQEKGEGVVWSRAGTGGNQRFPVCWSGDPAADWESLACTIRGGLSAGMSGIPFWSNDIGGYRGMPAGDLYVRWAQFGLLCSHSRMHGDSPREPWIYGDQILQIIRRYLRLRNELLPYIYSCAYHSSVTGVPVLRGMPLEFSGDRNASGHDLQFMLGPWILVAPVCSPDGVREVYFPRGAWFDFWSGSRIDGPTMKQFKSPLESLPMFVRGGGILPRQPAGTEPDFGQKRSHPSETALLIIELYPTDKPGKTSFGYYDDDGETAFELEWDGKRGRVQWRGNVRRRLTVKVMGNLRSTTAVVSTDGGESRAAVQIGGEAADESRRPAFDAGISTNGQLDFG